MTSQNYDNTGLLVIEKNPGVGQSGKPKPTISFTGESGGLKVEVSLWPNDKAKDGQKMYTGKFSVKLPNGETKDYAGEVAGAGLDDFDL